MNALIPVFVTGVIALLGLIITKESKISEFRQAWIDALRTEIAGLLASINLSIMILKEADGISIKDSDALSPEAQLHLATTLREANTALYTIRLRLNPVEQDSANILKALDEIEKLSNDADALAASLVSGRADEIERTLVFQAKIVLSAEWKRVKSGEPYFQVTRMVAAALAIAVALIVTLQAIFPPQISQKGAQENSPPVSQKVTLPQTVNLASPK